MNEGLVQIQHKTLFALEFGGLRWEKEFLGLVRSEDRHGLVDMARRRVRDCRDRTRWWRWK
jgi:hypothetical protein